MVHRRPRGAQLAQRVGAERREREEAVGFQDAADLCKSHIEIVAPLEHQIADGDVDARVRERQPPYVSAHTLEAPEQSEVALRFTQHAGRDVERDDRGAFVLPFQLAGQSPRTRAEIDDELRLELEEVEALEQLIADAGLQHRGRLVRRARAIEGAAHARYVEARFGFEGARHQCVSGLLGACA
jgi:hypothetical protein